MVGFNRTSTEVRELETSSLGNLILTLGGAKTRYVGIKEPVESGELIFITRTGENGEQFKIPVIVDSVENDKRLADLTDAQWQEAGHQSGMGYMARLNQSGLLRNTTSNAEDALTEAMARNHLETTRANSFTFHVAKIDELVAAGLSDKQRSDALNSVKAILADFDAAEGNHPEEVRDALDFAAFTRGFSADTLRENAGAVVAELRGANSTAVGSNGRFGSAG